MTKEKKIFTLKEAMELHMAGIETGKTHTISSPETTISLSSIRVKLHVIGILMGICTIVSLLSILIVSFNIRFVESIITKSVTKNVLTDLQEYNFIIE